MDACIANERMKHWKNKINITWTNQGMHDWLNEWNAMKCEEWTNGLIEWMNRWTNERMVERTNEMNEMNETNEMTEMNERNEMNERKKE